MNYEKDLKTNLKYVESENLNYKKDEDFDLDLAIESDTFDDLEENDEYLCLVSEEDQDNDNEKHTEEKYPKCYIEKEDRIITDTYTCYKAHKIEENEEPLSRVIGHKKQKEELLAVIEWFKHSKELKERGVSIPKGAILFGEPGNGKSLFIKEIIKCVEAPVFIFQGEQENVVAGIYDTFAKAREAGHSVIVFDELDLLIDKERRVIRALQENLDGVESSDDILVLAATNHIKEIPQALLRNGRLEKLIKIPYPTGEEALELLKKHFKEFGLSLPEDMDEEEVATLLTGISCAGVKSVVNDVILRNGFENITTKMIDNSIYNITDKVKDAPEKDNLQTAIHEASHALMAHSYPEFFKINRMSIAGASGQFCAKQIEPSFWPKEKAIADIKISMAGIIAEKIICGRWSEGSFEDLDSARHRAYRMFNLEGYSSCWENLPTSQGRRESFIKLRKMERKIERFLRKCEKETKKYVKAHKAEIVILGHALYEKKHLKSSEILALIG